MSELYDLIIIGGGPAGMSAAIYAGRAMLKTLVIDSDGGGQISITEEVVNYPGIVSISGKELMANMRRQIENFNVQYINAMVNEIDLERDLKTVGTDNGTFQSVAMVLATGAKPRMAGFDGEEKFKGRGVGYCATCDGQFFTGLDIFVIGGGLAAAEEAIFLTRYGKTVYLIVRGDSLSCPKSVIDKVTANEKIQVKYNTVIESVSGDHFPDTANLLNTKTNERTIYHSEDGKTFGTFVFAGYEPVTDLVKGNLELTASGYIITDGEMQTSIPGVYAAGDVRPKQLRQLVTAVSDGAMAATNAEKHIQERKQALNLHIEHTAKEEAPQAAENQFFEPALIDQLEPVLERFENDVHLVLLYDGHNPTGHTAELKNFLNELKPLSERIHIRFVESGTDSQLDEALGTALLPALGLFDYNQKFTSIQYHTMPGGHEFNSFVLALYNTAGPGQQIEAETIEAIQKLDQPVNIKLGVSLSCTMCPEVVMACQNIARFSDQVHLQVIDIFTHEDFKLEYNIMSVPAIVINDKDVSFGKKPIGEILKLITQ